MGFNWECYISLAEMMENIAEELKGDTEQECMREACLRSALSRFYYGVFGIAENILSRYIRVPLIDTHKFVICEYETAPDPQVQKVGENLKRLWGKRKKADYHDEMKDGDKAMDIEDIADVVKRANKKASKTVKLIKELKSGGFISSSTFAEDRCPEKSAQSLTQTSSE